MSTLRTRLILPLLLVAFAAGCAGRGSDSSLPSAVLPNSMIRATSMIRDPRPDSTYEGLILADDPIAFYQLADTGAKLGDSGPNGLSGTYGANVMRGAPALSTASTASASFPGAGAGVTATPYVASVPSAPMLSLPQTTLSVEAWVEPAAINTSNKYVPIVAYGRQAAGTAWQFQLTPQTNVSFWLKTAAGGFTISGPKLVPAQVYHLLATYDGSTVDLYLNGALAASTPAGGAINYFDVQTPNGLAIGGAAGGTSPSFAGRIGDVAVYGTALAAADVENHYLYGIIHPTLTEQPVAANAFVDSIGVNTHISATQSPYVTRWSTFQTMIGALGVHHIRDALVNVPADVTRMNTLAAMGIHADLNTSLTMTTAQIQAWLPQFSKVVESVEGANEPDDQNNPNWVSQTQAFQKLLYAAVKGTPSTANLPVLGPALTSEASWQSLGNVSASLDDGNVHDYMGQYNPGAPGFGSVTAYGTYGSIQYNLNVARIASVTKPIVATETGYGEHGDIGSVDDYTIVRYTPRLYLEQYLDGIARTDLYEFFDDDSSAGYSYHGLVEADGTPRPSYTVMKNLIGLLADPGAAFTPSKVSYQIGGNVNNLQHMLLQKRNGSLYLILWLEVPSYNIATGADIAVGEQTVTVSSSMLGSSGVTMSTFDNQGNITKSHLTASGNTVAVPVDDRVLVLSGA
jgi:hypothetical protein